MPCRKCRANVNFQEHRRRSLHLWICLRAKQELTTGSKKRFSSKRKSCRAISLSKGSHFILEALAAKKLAPSRPPRLQRPVRSGMEGFPQQLNWVAVKEPNLTYHSKETYPIISLINVMKVKFLDNNPVHGVKRNLNNLKGRACGGPAAHNSRCIRIVEAVEGVELLCMKLADGCG